MDPLLHKILTLLIVITSSFFVYWLPGHASHCEWIRNILFNDITLDLTNPESKWIIVRALLFRLSLFVFLHSSAVMAMRLLLGYTSPATKQDSKIIKLFNRIIQNTIEQSFIFVGLFIYFLFDGPSQRIGATNVINLAVWFVAGRILFSFGYIIGVFLGIQGLRAYGFALSVLVNSLLLENILLPQPYLSSYFLH